MHFGKIVKNVAYSRGLSAQDLAEILNLQVSDILFLYEKKAWTLNNIKAVSYAFDHDFLKYLEFSYLFQML
ncbi:MAG TPA: hypothetical protein VEV16_03695 [Daejeonella sp.]|nr:hypothetical protein [Daejeonella sp.]